MRRHRRAGHRPATAPAGAPGRRSTEGAGDPIPRYHRRRASSSGRQLARPPSAHALPERRNPLRAGRRRRHALPRPHPQAAAPRADDTPPMRPRWPGTTTHARSPLSMTTTLTMPTAIGRGRKEQVGV